VDAEDHRLALGRKVRQALGPAEPFDANAGEVRDIAHARYRLLLRNVDGTRE
jgi:hypothetical protein